ncbi:LTA4H isoform 4 [Pongo abelii]|uniref:LTA4H isoform 4 n=1 Tax=Pongo abelii TaxID=9601 RepID=A0A2J8XMU6_PONAB|nr:LTA4H isoform 4 [Pongo abelii]
MPEIVDTCSLASPASVCRTKHLHLRCSVDFTRRTLTGTAALTVQSQEDNLRSLVLDTKDLTIEKVVINGQEVKYALGERQSYKGSPMEISLPIALSNGSLLNRLLGRNTHICLVSARPSTAEQSFLVRTLLL